MSAHRKSPEVYLHGKVFMTREKKVIFGLINLSKETGEGTGEFTAALTDVVTGANVSCERSRKVKVHINGEKSQHGIDE